MSIDFTVIPPCLRGHNSFRIHSIPDDDPGARVEEGRTLFQEQIADSLHNGYFVPGTIMYCRGHRVRVDGSLLDRQKLTILKALS